MELGDFDFNPHTPRAQQTELVQLAGALVEHWDPQQPEFAVARRHQDPFQSLSEDYVREAQVLLRDFITVKAEQNQPGLASCVADNSQHDRNVYRPISHPHEIRVIEILAGPFDAPIEGILHHVSVGRDCRITMADGYTRRCSFAVSLSEGSAVCYTALSYCWGEPVYGRQVLIDGRPKAITQALSTALQHLRHVEHSVVLWIDQLCIDQDDLADKEAQIRLMGAIYEHAWNTVIWLGPETQQGAFRALESLREVTRFNPGEMFDAEREHIRVLLKENLRAFQSLRMTLRKPWFLRTWIIQEAVLSGRPYLMSGHSTTLWRVFSGDCMSLFSSSFYGDEEFAWLYDRSEAEDALVLGSINGLQIAAELWHAASFRATHQQPATLLDVLVDTRYAGATSSLDKVYGILGLCESGLSPDYSSSQGDLFLEVAQQSLNKEVEWLASRREVGGDFDYSVLYRILSCVDHDPMETQLPSWVPDWSQPRSTTALGYKTSTPNCFNAGGNPQDERHKDEVLRLGPSGRCLIVSGILVDRVRHLSPRVSSGEVYAENPRERNGHFLALIDFVASIPSSETNESVFAAFSKTIVAGKDGAGARKCPVEYTEIISLLCDETTGRRPSVRDQTYTPRQRKGRLTLQNLKVRNPGRTFQDLRRAYRAAVLNRRACWSEHGHLGLVPSYTKEGDLIYIFTGSAVPYVVRERADGTHMLVGECYVHYLMDGEYAREKAMEAEDLVIS